VAKGKQVAAVRNETAKASTDIGITDADSVFGRFGTGSTSARVAALLTKTKT
jgi:hypothetical protein